MSFLILLALYVVVNIIAFAMYGWDKSKAKKGEWRTKESSLLLIALLGPWGAILGMDKFRHKTQKLKFKLVYLFALLHVIIIAWFIWNC